MKKVIIAVCLFFLAGCASMSRIEGPVMIQKTIEIPGMKKDEIFEKSKMWVAKTFHSAKAVLEYENKETGVIIGNGIIKYPVDGMEVMVKSRWKIGFTMKEDIKDGKIRLTFDNLILHLPADNNSPASQVTLILEGDFKSAQVGADELGKSLTTYLISGAQDSNW